MSCPPARPWALTAALSLVLGLAGCPRSSGPSPAVTPPQAPPTGRPSPARAPRPVWIDTDPSVGRPDRDVDDGLALLQALHAPELRVRGVSSVFGNAALEHADPIARELVGAWAPDVPVFTGADGPHRAETPAVQALARALRAEPLTLLVLGPATNVAALLHHHPELAERIERVVAVAGRRPGQRFTTGETNDRGHRDFNFEQDPDAFAELLSHGVPVVLAPFEISSKVWVTAPFLDALAADPHAGRLVPPARRWLDLWRDTFAVDGFNPFDTLAVGRLTHPHLQDCFAGRARLEEGPDDRTAAAMQGTDAPTKPYLLVEPGPPEAGAEGVHAVVYCHDVDAGRFLDTLARQLTAGPPPR